MTIHPNTLDDVMTEAQRRKLFALTGEYGIRDRTNRLHVWSSMLGRPVASTTDLNRSDASELIEALILANELF